MCLFVCFCVCLSVCVYCCACVFMCEFMCVCVCLFVCVFIGVSCVVCLFDLVIAGNASGTSSQTLIGSQGSSERALTRCGAPLGAQFVV